MLEYWKYLEYDKSKKGEKNMEFDAKQKVLLAVYMEYQKDIPNMKSITAKTVGLEEQVYKIAVDKLSNEGLIRDATLTHGGGKIVSAWLDNVKMTPYGLNYVETKLAIQPEKTGMEKIKEISEKAVSWGWNEAKDFAAKVLAEIMKV